MHSIEIVTPAPPKSLYGNRITAQRWQGFLKKLGYKTAVTQSWSGKDLDLLIALHAYRSYSSIKTFKEAHPNKPVLLMITGTDIYRDMLQHPEVHMSMKLADAIVVLQPEAITSIPERYKDKAHVIYQSVEIIKSREKPKRSFLLSVIGHLRPEKDPFCIVRAIPYLDEDSRVKIQHLGMAMNRDMKKSALQYSKKIDRYSWLGERSHRKTLQELARSHILVISSRMEGGAHVVSEAIAAGTPVIASAIAGNRGLLGKNYPGYFPVEDEHALAQLIMKVETNPEFYQSLERHVKALQKQVQPQRELASIKKLVRTLIS